MKSFNFLKIIEIFSPDKLLILCPMLYYADFLGKKMENPINKWSIPYGCFKTNVEEIFLSLRKALSNGHLKFLKSYLKNIAKDESDEIVQILREKIGAMLRIQNLLTGQGMFDIWNNEPEIREKLINRNCLFFENIFFLNQNF